MALPRGFIDEVLARTSIVDLVGRRVAWDRRKSNAARGDLWACCPFHSEKTPSFHVDAGKGVYHCFGCLASGNALTFLEETEGLTRLEAVERLAREAGLPMPRPETREKVRAQIDRQTRLMQCLDAAATRYEAWLLGAEGEAARAYLKRRGLNGEIARSFGLGYAPAGWQNLLDALGRDGLRPDLLVAAGLARARRDGSGQFDFFRNRIMFPIHDPTGRLIAFGGRTLDPDEDAKYINSPEGDLFKKGEVIYNLHRAAPSARKDGRVFVAEGYMDVIALTRAGCANAVAPLGTALTEAQLRRLFQVVPEVVLVLDGDAAGREAARRGLALGLSLVTPHHSLKVAFLPEGQDPDDLLTAGGPEALQRALDDALETEDALWRQLTEGVDLASPRARARLEIAVDEALGVIADARLKRHFRDLFRERLWALFRGGGSGRAGPAGVSARLKGKADLAALKDVAAGEADLLLTALLLDHPALAEAYGERLADLTFADKELDALKQRLVDMCATHTSLDSAALKGHLFAQSMETWLAGTLGEAAERAAGLFSADAAETEIEEGFIRLLTRREALQAALAEAGPPASGDRRETPQTGQRSGAMRKGLERLRSQNPLLDAVKRRAG